MVAAAKNSSDEPKIPDYVPLLAKLTRGSIWSDRQQAYP